MTARLTYAALFLAGGALFWFASERPVEALAAYLICAAILLLIEWAERRGTLSEPTWHGRWEWVDDAQIIRGATSAPSPGHQAETHDEGDSHDHAV